MKITILGFYGGYPFDGIGTSGYLVQSGNFNLLLDCGSGVLLELEKILNPLQLDAVLLSHYHSDHIADIGVLQHYWQISTDSRKEKTLPIYGNKKDKVSLNRLNWFNDTIGIGYDADDVLELGPLEISFLPTQHPVPTFAIRIREKSSNETLVYTGDTRYFDDMIPFCHNADLLITDTNFYDDHQGTKWHMTAGESGYLAKRSFSHQLMLSHLPQWGNWDELRSQAQKCAGSEVEVLLPQKNYTIRLNH